MSDLSDLPIDPIPPKPTVMVPVVSYDYITRKEYYDEQDRMKAMITENTNSTKDLVELLNNIRGGIKVLASFGKFASWVAKVVTLGVLAWAAFKFFVYYAVTPTKW